MKTVTVTQNDQIKMETTVYHNIALNKKKNTFSAFKLKKGLVHEGCSLHH